LPVHLNNNIFNSIRLTNANTSHISTTHTGRTGLSSQDGNLFDIPASFRWWNSERPADNLPRGESFTLSDYTTNCYDTSATAPAITTSSFYDAQQGVEYTATLIGYGGRTPYTWSVQNGALPTGLTLAADGTITGTPTEAGNFTIDAQITDLNSVSNTKTLSITVVGAATTPTTPEIVDTTNNDSSNDTATTDSDGGGALWGLNIFALLLMLSTRKVQRSRQRQA
jgi:hypothetical protein